MEKRGSADRRFARRLHGLEDEMPRATHECFSAARARRRFAYTLSNNKHDGGCDQLIPRMIPFLVFAVGATIVIGCSGSSSVDISVSEYTFGLERPVVGAGDVTFRLTNAGNEDHEFAVIRTDLAPDSLPIRDGEWVDEGAPGLSSIGGFDHLLPDRTKELSLRLESGNYVLLCNMQGHYQRGMYAALTVE